MTRTSLHSLKLQAYALYEVSTTKQLKKKLGKGYDMRYRSTWLQLLGQRNAANNIVSFKRPIQGMATQDIYEQLRAAGCSIVTASKAAKSIAAGFTASDSAAVRKAYFEITRQ